LQLPQNGAFPPAQKGCVVHGDLDPFPKSICLVGWFPAFPLTDLKPQIFQNQVDLMGGFAQDRSDLRGGNQTVINGGGRVAPGRALGGVGQGRDPIQFDAVTCPQDRFDGKLALCPAQTHDPIERRIGLGQVGNLPIVLRDFAQWRFAGQRIASRFADGREDFVGDPTLEGAGFGLGATKDQGVNAGLVDIVLLLNTTGSRGVQFLDILLVNMRINGLSWIPEPQSHTNIITVKPRLPMFPLNYSNPVSLKIEWYDLLHDGLLLSGADSFRPF
jgi:hypothetical protein